MLANILHVREYIAHMRNIFNIISISRFSRDPQVPSQNLANANRSTATIYHQQLTVDSTTPQQQPVGSYVKTVRHYTQPCDKQHTMPTDEEKENKTMKHSWSLLVSKNYSRKRGRVCTTYNIALTHIVGSYGTFCVSASLSLLAFSSSFVFLSLTTTIIPLCINSFQNTLVE